MIIEKDLNTIKKAAIIKENENIEFRSFLKTVNMKTAEIDSIVHKIYQDVIKHIDCSDCANCCIMITPTLDNSDIKKFITGLDINKEDFKIQYLTEIKSNKNEEMYELNSLPCPFLKNTMCSNYSNRPWDCESFPHLQKNSFVSRLWGVIENYGICPIVFNVFEELKSVLWKRRNQLI